MEAPFKPWLTMSSSQETLQRNNVEGFRHLAHSIVSRALAIECEYDRIGRPKQDEQSWKLIKRQNLLYAYKCKTHDVVKLDQSRRPVQPKRPPMVICVGSVDGTVEDILYGLHAKTRTEMSAVTTFMNKRPSDCDMLGVLDSGSDKDPFRHLSLKYFLTEAFGDARVVKNRDFCVIQSMGTGLDPWGRRYGYYLLRSIGIPECSPLPADNNVVRAKVTMCSIFRQASSSRVNVYSKAAMDPGGSLPDFMVYDATAALLFSTAEEATTSAIAKRLSLLALQQQKAQELVSSSEQEMHLLSSRYSKAIHFRAMRSSSTMSSHATKRPSPSSQKKPCNICGKTPTVLSLARFTHRTCSICVQFVCSKCSVKYNLCAREQVADVCCKTCLLAAKELSVDPRDPCPMLM